MSFAPCHRYKEVVETVLRFRDSKEKLIRRAVIVLLPRLAHFAPERFAQVSSTLQSTLRTCSAQRMAWHLLCMLHALLHALLQLAGR